MQKIEIRKLVVPTLIGVYDWERKQNTNLLLSVELWADLTKAMSSDAVADTIDYAVVADAIKTLASSTAFELLEALGQSICQHLLATFAVDKVVLCIEKPEILPDAQVVSVTMAFDKQGVVSL